MPASSHRRRNHHNRCRWSRADRPRYRWRQDRPRAAALRLRSQSHQSRHPRHGTWCRPGARTSTPARRPRTGNRSTERSEGISCWPQPCSFLRACWVFVAGARKLRVACLQSATFPAFRDCARPFRLLRSQQQATVASQATDVNRQLRLARPEAVAWPRLNEGFGDRRASSMPCLYGTGGGQRGTGPSSRSDATKRRVQPRSPRQSDPPAQRCDQRRRARRPTRSTAPQPTALSEVDGHSSGVVRILEHRGLASIAPAARHPHPPPQAELPFDVSGFERLGGICGAWACGHRGQRGKEAVRGAGDGPQPPTQAAVDAEGVESTPKYPTTWRLGGGTAVARRLNRARGCTCSAVVPSRNAF